MITKTDESDDLAIDKCYSKMLNQLFQNLITGIKNPGFMGVRGGDAELKWLMGVEEWCKKEQFLFDCAEIFLGIEKEKFKDKIIFMVGKSIEELKTKW